MATPQISRSGRVLKKSAKVKEMEDFNVNDLDMQSKTHSSRTSYEYVESDEDDWHPLHEASIRVPKISLNLSSEEQNPKKNMPNLLQRMSIKPKPDQMRLFQEPSPNGLKESENIENKLIKVWSLSSKKAIMCSNMQEMMEKGSMKLNILNIPNLKAFLQDGTELDDDEVFQALPPGTVVYLLNEDEEKPWEVSVNGLINSDSNLEASRSPIEILKGSSNTMFSFPEKDGTVVVDEITTTVQTPHTIIAEANPQLITPKVASQPIEKIVDDCVNWHLVPKNITECLEKGQDIKPTEFRALVRHIAADILKMNANPSKKLVVKIAEKCVVKFPVLKDTFNSITIGTGSDNLSYRLYTRIENLKRKQSTSHQNSDSPVKRRKVQIDSYGCVAWSINLPDGVTINELMEKKRILNKINSESDIDEAIKLLEETYYLQRLLINDNCKISKIMKEWPMLFSERGLEAHFKILTKIELFPMIEKTITSRGKILLSFFRTSKSKEVQAFMTEIDMKYEKPDEMILVILGLAKFFDEATSFVFFTEEVSSPHNLDTIPKHPCLVGKGTSIFNCNEFVVTVDGIAICTFKYPAAAVASWFATYYIFNIKYPIEFSCTLEFFQRCFVGINPESGSKTEKKKGKKSYSGVHPKVLNLLKKLNKFECWINDCRVRK